MEIIFTLILLIGFGINSHRYDVKKHEIPKQEITSFIEEDFSNNQLQVLSNTEGEINYNNNNELSEVIQNSEIKTMESKGKYISVRIND